MPTVIMFLFLVQRAYQAFLPNPVTTPGATNPAITQATIGQTICNPHWSTKSIRPPASYTTALKRQQMRAWGLPGTTSEYEEDHLISLEIGGAPRDPRNLWPEPYAGVWGAKKKDALENRLHRLVCAATITLADAQHAIATDWIVEYLRRIGVVK